MDNPCYKRNPLGVAKARKYLEAKSNGFLALAFASKVWLWPLLEPSLQQTAH